MLAGCGSSSLSDDCLSSGSLRWAGRPRPTPQRGLLAWAESVLSDDKVDMLETVETVLVVSMWGSSTPESAVESLALPEIFAIEGLGDAPGEMLIVTLGVSFIRRPLAKG